MQFHIQMYHIENEEDKIRHTHTQILLLVENVLKSVVHHKLKSAERDRGRERDVGVDMVCARLGYCFVYLCLHLTDLAVWNEPFKLA